LSRKSKHSFNLYQYSKLSQGNNSTNQSIPVNEGSFTNDYALNVIIGESGYFFQTDEHPIENGRGRLRTGPGVFSYRSLKLQVRQCRFILVAFIPKIITS
jgi:hypothetical protein